MVRSLLVVAMLGTTAVAQPAAPPPAQPAAPPAAPPVNASDPMAPTPPSTVAPVAAPAPFEVMNDRWSVGLQFGWQTLTIQHGEKPKTSFGSFTLAGHYRIFPPAEIGVVFYGGGSAGDLSIAGVYLEGRYRFHAQQPWNFYGSLGIGATGIANKMSTDEQKKGRGTLYLGFGVERRFTHFALDAEVHVLSVGENKDLPEPTPVTRVYELERYGLAGGGLLFGALYYF